MKLLVLIGTLQLLSMNDQDNMSLSELIDRSQSSMTNLESYHLEYTSRTYFENELLSDFHGVKGDDGRTSYQMVDEVLLLKDTKGTLQVNFLNSHMTYSETDLEESALWFDLSKVDTKEGVLEERGEKYVIVLPISYLNYTSQEITISKDNFLVEKISFTSSLNPMERSETQFTFTHVNSAFDVKEKYEMKTYLKIRKSKVEKRADYMNYTLHIAS